MRRTYLTTLLITLVLVLSTGIAYGKSQADSIRQAMKTLTDKELLAAHRSLFEVYYYSDDTEGVYQVCEEWAQEAERQGDINEASNARFDKIVLYYDLKFYDQVIEKAPHELEWHEQHEQWVNYIDTWFMLTDAYLNVGKLQTALHQVKDMTASAQKTGNNYLLAAAYGLMSLIYSNIDLDESVAAARRSIALLMKEKEIKLNGQLSLSYYNLQNALKKKKDYTSLLAACDEWLKILDENKKEGEQYGLQYCDCLLFRAEALIPLGRYDEAEETIESAKEYSKQEFQDGEAKYSSICYYYAWLAMERGDMTRALRYSDSVMAKTVTIIDEDYQMQRANILQRVGRGSEAADIFRQMYEMKDSVFSREMRMQLDEMNTLLKVDELKMESRLQRSRFSLIIIALIALALGILFFTSWRSHKKLLKAYGKLEETTTAKERIESELRIARDIQMGMVPSQFPERPDFDLFASMTPAKEVGGDLYDYLLLNDQLYFCVGDVSGKGVPASLFMSQTIRLFRALAKQQQLPAYIATRLNAELSENNNSGMFVTMFIGLVDLPTGHLRFCNAGHNPPVLGGDAQHGSFIEMEPNAPLGLWPELDYVGEEIDSIKGRPFFAYTDGLNEAENMVKEQFGDERMLTILRNTKFENSRQVIEHLKQEVNKHRNGAEPNDDLTMLCLQVK